MTASSPLRSRRIEANGIDFALLEAGPADGPLALCLHGYPDTAATWRHLAPALAAEGWHVVAPYLRGYAPSGLAADGCYQLGAVARDANALHEVLGGGDDALLVGHDWGALAAYPAAVLGSQRWRRVVTLAVPPAGALGGMLGDFDQLKRSWYIFFQLTPFAEPAVTADGFAFIGRLWADWSPGYDATEDVAAVAEALAEPAHLSAALGYYRAYFGGEASDPALAAEQAAMAEVPPQPTLYLHGGADGCVGAELADGAAMWLADGSDVRVLDGVGHFLHLEDPDRVNALVVEFAGRR